MSRLGDIARQVPWLPVVALLFALGIVTYAVFNSDSASAPTGETLQPQRTLATPSVLITSPADVDTVSNPVSVSMAIGGGLVYQAEGGPLSPGLGHLWLLIDAPAPDANATLTADDIHIDLSDGSHKTTLPTLSPGQHTLTAVWTDSENTTYSPSISNTITVTVSPPAS